MSPKITYFNIKGVAELLRWICKYGDIEFEDIRITHDQWPELKPKTPFGQVPTYEEDGKVIGQSIAIARYLAKKVKLVGETDWENLEIDSIVDTLTDLKIKVTQLHFEKDPERLVSIKDTLTNETIPFYLERLDKIALENEGHMAGKKLSWADFYLANCLNLYEKFMDVDIISKYTNLVAIKEKVENIPNIKNWIEDHVEN